MARCPLGGLGCCPAAGPVGMAWGKGERCRGRGAVRLAAERGRARTTTKPLGKRC